MCAIGFIPIENPEYYNSSSLTFSLYKGRNKEKISQTVLIPHCTVISKTSLEANLNRKVV
jgi:hypothetical protein